MASNAEFGEQPPQQRQADPDHVVRIAVDGGHVSSAEPVHGECAGDLPGLTRGHVGVDLVVGEQWGKVRALINDKGETIPEAGPSVPVSYTHLDVYKRQLLITLLEASSNWISLNPGVSV